jgi:hypothetical protein
MIVNFVIGVKECETLDRIGACVIAQSCLTVVRCVKTLWCLH